MGDPRMPTIRHLEEAHSAFGRPDERSSIKGQQATLVDAANIILDEIAYGRRDCIVIATTDQPEQFDPAIYRRFVERGMIIDVNEIWDDPANLREVVCLELRRSNHPRIPWLSDRRTSRKKKLTSRYKNFIRSSVSAACGSPLPMSGGSSTR